MSLKMRQFLSSFVLFFILTPLYSQAEVVDKVVAVVNEDIITLSELEAEAAGLYQKIAQQLEGQHLLEAMSEARETTLDNMINQRLIQQRAALFNVTVTREEIDQAYETMRQKNKLGEAEFRRELLQSGLTEESYRKQLQASILQSKVLSIDVRSKIAITDEMILAYYDEHYTSRVDGDSYYLLQIGFTWNSNLEGEALAAAKAQAMNMATRIWGLAKDGQDFKTLARKFSDLPSATDGGDIGTFTLDEMAEAMRSAVTGLGPGAISDIVETSSAFQFFKLLSGEEDTVVVTDSYEDVEDQIRERIYDEKLKEAYQDWVKQLKEEAFIQKL